jgi:hypothetical protein
MVGDRCPCAFRKKWLMQCRHEFVHDGSFDSDKVDNRWHNNGCCRTVEEVVDSYDPDNSASEEGTDDDNFSLGGATGMEDKDDDDEDAQTLNKLGCQSVMVDCEILLWLVASDQRCLYDVSQFISSSIERAKSDLPLSFAFSSTVACDPSSNGTG